MSPCISLQPRQRADTSSFLGNKGYSREEREAYLRDFSNTFFGVILDVEDLERIEELYPAAGQFDTLVNKENRRELSQFYLWRGDYEYLIQTGGGSNTRRALERLPTSCQFYHKNSNQLVRGIFEYVKSVAGRGDIAYHFRRRSDPEPSYLPTYVHFSHQPHYVFEPCNCDVFERVDSGSTSFHSLTLSDF